jgi:hypothetical protein
MKLEIPPHLLRTKMESTLDREVISCNANKIFNNFQQSMKVLTNIIEIRDQRSTNSLI